MRIPNADGHSILAACKSTKAKPPDSAVDPIEDWEYHPVSVLLSFTLSKALREDVRQTTDDGRIEEQSMQRTMLKRKYGQIDTLEN